MAATKSFANRIPAAADGGRLGIEVNLTPQVQAWVNGAKANNGITLMDYARSTALTLANTAAVDTGP